MEGMEISCDGFSIRGYTSEMRSKDMSKCWPFSSQKSDNLIQDVLVHDFLPEITVKKFRWWAHELRALGSNSNHASSSTQPLLKQQTVPGLLVNGNTWMEGEEGEKSELVCPVCGVFAAATVTVVNTHITSCIAQSIKEERWQMEMKNSKGKLKSPKKRSITEIFAVAPQIETVESIDGDEENEVEEELHCDKRGSIDHGVSKRKKNTTSTHANKKSKDSKKKKMRRMKKMKLEKSATLMKIKRRRKKLLKKGLPAKKENEYKLKLQTPVRRARKQKGRRHSKRPLVDATDGISDCNQKSELEPISKGNKRKVQNSKPVPKVKNKELLHGILKKNHHPKSHSDKKLKICNNEDGAGVTYWGDAEVLPSNRHVRFSDKDDILGSEVRNSSSSGKRLLNFFLDVVAAAPPTAGNSGRNEKREKANVESANKCLCSVSSKTDERNQVQSACENDQLSKCPEHVTILTPSKPHLNHEKTMHLALNSGTENQVASINYPHIDKGKMTAMNSTPYADYPQSSMSSQHRQDSFMNYPPSTTISGSFYSSVNLSDCILDSTYSMTSLDPRMNRRPYMQPSAAFSALNENERNVCQSLMEDNDYHAPQRCQLSQLFSLGRIDNFCPSVDWTNGNAAFRHSRGNEKSFCLPLNSHGELIRFSSTDNLAYGHGELSTLSGLTSSGLPVNLVLPSSQENLRTRESDVPGIALTRCTVNPIPNYPARLGVTDQQLSERAEAHWSLFNGRWNGHDCPTGTGRSSTKNSFDEHQNNQIGNQQANRMIHLKDRLDFSPVCTSQPTMRLMGKDVAICSGGDLQLAREKVQNDLESRRMISCRETTSGSSLLKRTPQEDKSFSLSSRTPIRPISQAVSVNCRERSHSMLLSCDPESRSTHFLSNPRGNAVCQRGNFHLGRGYLLPLDHSPGCYPVLDREAADFTLPFMSEPKHTELKPHLQVPPTFSSTGQNTYVSSVELIHKNLPLAKSAYDFSLAHRGHDAPSSCTAPHFLNRTEQEHAPMNFPYPTRMASIKQDMQGSSFLTMAPVYHPTEFSHPFNALTPHLQMKSSLVPDSFVHTPCFTTLHGVDANIPMTMCRQKTLVMDRMLDFGSSRDHDLFPGSRKRPATNIDGSVRPTKIPNLPMQDFSNLTVLPLESSRAIDFDQGGADGNGKVSFHDETQNFTTPVHAGFDSWSPYGVVRSGTTKLTSGAKKVEIQGPSKYGQR